MRRASLRRSAGEADDDFLTHGSSTTRRVAVDAALAAEEARDLPVRVRLACEPPGHDRDDREEGRAATEPVVVPHPIACSIPREK